jgi:ABC-type bacteriocin/lantibiotic exporter with double-glycine peptidase domain
MVKLVRFFISHSMPVCCFCILALLLFAALVEKVWPARDGEGQAAAFAPVPRKSGSTGESNRDCGLICLLVVADLFGKDPGPLKGLKSQLDGSRAGVDLVELQAGAESLGLKARAVEIDSESLAAFLQPGNAAILHCEQHYIVVVLGQDGKVRVADTRQGAYECSIGNLSQVAKWDGRAMLLTAL